MFTPISDYKYLFFKIKRINDKFSMLVSNRSRIYRPDIEILFENY